MSSKLISVLEQSFNNKNTNINISRSFLISGPKGVGKYSLIINYINNKLINDKSIKPEEHPDIFLIKEESNITIDTIRSIKNFAYLKSFSLDYKIVIIDNAENMNINASNALLKLLEEPPINFFIFIITHNPGKLLTTIRSRCIRLHFPLPKIEDSLILVQTKLPSINAQEVHKILSINDHCAGAAIKFYQDNGLEFYLKMLELMIYHQLHGLDVIKIERFIGQFVNSKENNKNSWDNFIKITNHLLLLLTKYIIDAGEITDDLFAQEAQIIELSRHKKNYRLDNLIKLWEKIHLLMLDKVKSNLDEKTVIFIIFKHFMDLDSE